MKEIYTYANDYMFFAINNENKLGEYIDGIKTIPMFDNIIDKCLLVFPEEVNIDSILIMNPI